MRRSGGRVGRGSEAVQTDGIKPAIVEARHGGKGGCEVDGGGSFVSVAERIDDLVRFAAVDYVDTLFQQGW